MTRSLASTTPSVHQDLRQAIADLEVVNAGVGLVRFGLIGALFLSVVGLAWTASDLLLLVVYSAIAGVLYTFCLVCTHDAAHATLTGWRWFDATVARLISYPMAWPYGTYAQLHRLHHAWNGIDLRDPERVQWTIAEYRQAPRWQQWYVRHQWVIDLFLLGGIGLIAKTTWKGWQLRHQAPALRWALLLDGGGIGLVQATLILVAIVHGRWVDYLLFWLVLERTVGGIMQARDHLEHYGLWQTGKNHLLTQLYACRNLTTSPLVAWLMGGLPDHALHHAFPSIPFNHLPEASRRTEAVLVQHQLAPMPREAGGYLRETLRLGRQPLLIGEAGLHSPVPGLSGEWTENEGEHLG